MCCEEGCEVYTGQKMLRMGLPGGRKRGRPKRRFLDAIREDMKVVGLTEEDAGDRVKWKGINVVLWRPLTGIAERERRSTLSISPEMPATCPQILVQTPFPDWPEPAQG